MDFAKRLKELRTATGMSQSELATLSGIPTSTIKSYEQGQREPGLSVAAKLAKALECSLDDFVEPPAAKKRRGK